MQKFKLISIALVIGALIASSAFGADAKPAAVKTAASAPAKDIKETKDVKEVKEPTSEDMVKSIGSSLDNFSEIAAIVPGFKKETDASGKSSYTYQGVKLENVDKEQLKKLYARVNGEASRLRTGRINNQMENIRRINQINQQNRQIRPVYQPPRPAYQPPRPVVPPSPPQTLPKRQY